VCCSALQCVAVCCSVSLFQRVAGNCYCSVLQCVAVCCSVLQCVAACCSLLQCVKCVETLREIAVKYIEQRGNFYRHPCRRVACVADMLQCVCVLQVCCRCVADVLQVCYRCVADVLQRMSNTLKSM